ncbi:LPXTG cell wall anchor domain-containing protein [Streptomyces sp. NPDC051907]|uniref:LPXTG cell wall anchor domain-containing protein n=1 Tax=Streptomyces sp. NPDC051907 TaxID=3155284 RepID=UPI00341FBCE0
MTVTNAKTATTPPPTDKPTEKPTEKPSDKPTQDKPGKDEDTPAPSASGIPAAGETASSTAAPDPEGSLAHTGADATPWLIGGGLLIAAGGGALFAARRRRTDTPPTTAPPRADLT